MNIRKAFRKGSIKGYSNFEQWRMFAGAAEVVYANPSIKRLKEIENYCESLIASNNTDFTTKRKAKLLSSECRSNATLKDLIKKYRRVI